MDQVRHRHSDVGKRSSVVDSEDARSSRTDAEEQLADGDAVLKCFRPLLSSLRVLGLYFTPASGPIHDLTSSSTAETTDSKVPRKWNGGHIYATIMLAVSWLNAARMLSAFDKTEKFGVLLLLKLAANSTGLLGLLLQTACFVAAHGGHLDRVFRDARLAQSDVTRYRRLALIHAVVCWIAILAGIPLFVVPVFFMDYELNLTMLPFGVHVLVSGNLLVLVKLLMSTLNILANCLWYFSHSVNYMVTSVLYDQFRALNKDFQRALGPGGEFRGNIREFRRRHQSLCQSVETADQFMMISNVGGFCCEIVNLILILYCTIFFGRATLGSDAMFAMMYVFWLLSTLISLTLTACQGVVINHAAHSLTTRVHGIDLLSLDKQSVAETIVFLDRLHGDPIGFSVLGIFVIGKNTILTVIGVLVTYFLLVVQFGMPFDGSTADSATMTNVTCSE